MAETVAILTSASFVSNTDYKSVFYGKLNKAQMKYVNSTADSIVFIYSDFY